MSTGYSGGIPGGNTSPEQSILFLLWTVASPLSWASPAPSQTGGVEASHSQAALSPLLLHEAPVLCSGRCTPTGPQDPIVATAGPWGSSGKAFVPVLPAQSQRLGTGPRPQGPC